MPRTIQKKLLYGINWNIATDPLHIEMEMCRRGGEWVTRDGRKVGNGMFFHWKRAHEIIWPWKKWHRWSELETRCYLQHKYIGEMGCAAAGKTQIASSNALFDWYLWPTKTTVLISSTDLKSLDVRAWGSIKQLHREAKERFPWLPGNLIEGRRVIIIGARSDSAEGRDFKNGLLAVPTKIGSVYVGLGPLVGIHNKRIRMVADELNLMPKIFLDSTSNLSKCEDFKMVGIGQPSETTNAHGDLCEPHPAKGGWESNIDQTPGTKTWETKWPNGICIQLPGSDSPNYDVPEGQPPPYPFLITREQMKEDAQHWGTDDWHFTMMNEGRMPRGQGSRRVLTRQTCLKFHALEDPVWRDTAIRKIAFLDAGYGGDRCVFGEMHFGRAAETTPSEMPVTGIIDRSRVDPLPRHLVHIVELTVIPVSGQNELDLPEDQIVRYVREQLENRVIPLDDFFYDPGMRTSLVTAFSRLMGGTGNPIDCGGKATTRPVGIGTDVLCSEYYSKFVTELWYSVRLAVEADQVRGLPKEAMWEFCAREWRDVSGNRVELESKDDMKRKTGRSPDLADAVAIGLEGCRQRGFMIAKIGNPKSAASRRNQGDRWKRDAERSAFEAWHASDLNYAV